MFWITFLWQQLFLLALFQVIKISQIHKTEILTLSNPVFQKTASVWEKTECELLFSHSLCTGRDTESLLLNKHYILHPQLGFSIPATHMVLLIFAPSPPLLCCCKIRKIQAQDALWIKLSSHSFLHISPGTNLEAISPFKNQQAEFPKQSNPVILMLSHQQLSLDYTAANTSLSEENHQMNSTVCPWLHTGSQTLATIPDFTLGATADQSKEIFKAA